MSHKSKSSSFTSLKLIALAVMTVAYALYISTICSVVVQSYGYLSGLSRIYLLKRRATPLSGTFESACPIPAV